MVALFLGDNKHNNDGDGKKNGKKYTFLLTNNNFALASGYFVHNLLPALHHYDMKLPHFTSPLYGVGEQHTKIVAFFF